jgi:putative transposase
LLRSNPDRLARLTVQERPGKTCFRLWQEGAGFDRNVYTAEAISASIDYIHNNPVKRGLCERAVKWKWSSARFYLGTLPCQQEAGLPFIHGLPNGVFA